ncbi:unnamed protein product [Meganyctiphanes norvegica]|uniref:Uncharacterized protein n=1 Tax=Meganyctiphanes norvegica TaxID=48144 RepID=A0AAV2PXW5_MEGNR
MGANQCKPGVCTSDRRMDGKVIIVTGANSGLGLETAKDLVGRGAILVMACRNRESTLQAESIIRSVTPAGEIHIMDLDLGDLDSVHRFARDFLEKFNRLDVLINNAGIFLPPDQRKLTKDGFEMHMGVNYWGHFLLTHLLLDRIKATPNSRIVIVASVLAWMGSINFDNMDVENGWKPKKPSLLYSHSKLANMYHAQALYQKLKGSGVNVYTLCPGFVNTGLMRYTKDEWNSCQMCCLSPIVKMIARTPEKGAQTAINCAVSEDLDEVEFGFFQNCKLSDMKPVATDSLIRDRLWDYTMDRLKLSDDRNKLADTSQGDNLAYTDIE